jgi:hypothetical protein
MMLSEQAQSNLTPDHLNAVQQMQDFFYYYVWRYPCLIISRETASGPSADELRAVRQQRISTFDEELCSEARRFEGVLEDAGLIPEYTDYPSDESSCNQEISKLVAQYFQN